MLSADGITSIDVVSRDRHSARRLAEWTIALLVRIVVLVRKWVVTCCYVVNDDSSSPMQCYDVVVMLLLMVVVNLGWFQERMRWWIIGQKKVGAASDFHMAREVGPAILRGVFRGLSNFCYCSCQSQISILRISPTLMECRSLECRMLNHGSAISFEFPLICLEFLPVDIPRILGAPWNPQNLSFDRPTPLSQEAAPCREDGKSYQQLMSLLPGIPSSLSIWKTCTLFSYVSICLYNIIY